MTAAPVARAVPQPAPSRMRLANVTKGKIAQKLRVCVYGPEGVGKTTFAAHAPNPIWLCAENGTDEHDIARLPTPEAWTDVLEAIRMLTNEPHEYETFVVDTLDWIEPLLWAHICKRDGVDGGIEGYGYGKGYQAAADEWRVFLAALDRLKQRMHIVLLAHAQIKTFKNPSGEDFDRYSLKVHEKGAGPIREWCSAVLFANWETFAKKPTADSKKAKGISTGARVLYTERRAAFDAKNRYSLPEELPLAWEDFEAAARAGAVAPVAELRAEIERKAKALGGELETKIMETLAKAGDSAESLALINNKVNAKLAEKGQ